MASISKQTVINAHPDAVWAALSDFHAVHERVAAGFVVDSRPDGEGARLVTFFNGAVAREVLVSIDEDGRRLVYSVVDSPMGFTHYNAAAQVFDEDDGRSRFVWTVDLLPDDAAGLVDQMIDQGLAAIKRTLEAQAAPTAGGPSTV